jgi:N4-gp56 family major capsid protein
MAAFYNNMTTTTSVSDAVIDLWEKTFLLAAYQQDVTSQFADVRQIAGKTDHIMKYTNFAAATTPLTETDDADRAAMAEVPIVVTPLEYGHAVTTTSLASLQTGGQVDLAAIEVTGVNMGRTMNALGVAALEATSNVTAANAGGAASNTATDVISLPLINKAYNRLSRANIATVEGGLYVAMAHDDVLYDLRNSTSAGSWMDINKYTNITPLQNEVGAYGGFRWIRNNDCAIDADGGASAVDNYKVSFFGARALVNVVSMAPGLRFTGPFDALARFVNIGWYGVFKFAILDVAAVQQVIVASSVGAN